MPVLQIEYRIDDNAVNHTYPIGLDLHAKSTSIAYAGSDGSLESHGACASTNLSGTLRKLAARLGTEFESLEVCDKVGPIGFVLARLHRAGEPSGAR